MTTRTFNSIKPIENGYFLESQPNFGFLGVYIPEFGRNYVHNPAMTDVDNNGLPDQYFINNLTLTKLTDSPFFRHAWRGSGNATSNIQYQQAEVFQDGRVTFSVWVKGPIAGTQFNLRLRATPIATGVIEFITSSNFYTTTEWKQYTFTHNFGRAVGSIEATLFWSNNSLSQPFIDVAGFQIENKLHATSFIHGYAGNGYEWLGQPFDSPSDRSADVICGGRLVNLKELGMQLRSVDGLGIPDSFDHQVTARAFDLGSIFNCLTIEDRDIDMEFTLYTCSLHDLLCARNKIGCAIFDINKPRCFVWQPYECENVICPEVHFTAVYNDGFSFGYNSHFGEEISLSFTNYDIAMFSDTDCMDLGLFEPVTGDPIIGTDSSGAIVQFPPFPIPGGCQLYQVNDAIVSPYDNSLYASTSIICGPGIITGILWRYDGTTWTNIGTTNGTLGKVFATSKYVFAAIDNGGTMTLTAPFIGTSGNGLAIIDLAQQNIAVTPNINPALVNNAVGNPVNPSINAFAVVGNRVYIGGNFTGIGGLGSPDLQIFDLLTENFQSVPVLNRGTINGGVLSLLNIPERQELWIGGDFWDTPTHPNNSAEAKGIYAINTDTGAEAWTSNFFGYDYPIASFNHPSGGIQQQGIVAAMTYYKGKIIIGGKFLLNQRFSTNLRNIAFIEPGRSIIQGFPNRLAVTELQNISTGVKALTQCPNRDAVLVGGHFDTYSHFTDSGNANSIVPDGQACGNFDLISSSSGEFSQPSQAEVQFGTQGSANPQFNCHITTITCGSDRIGVDVIYLNSGVINAGGNPIASSSLITNKIYMCSCLLATKPKVFVRGPGMLKQIRNATNNTSVYFDYQLIENEIIEIDMSQRPIQVTSNLNGDISSEVLTASNNIILEPGDNVVTIRIEPDSVNDDTEAWICYTNRALAAEQLCNCGCLDLID